MPITYKDSGVDIQKAKRIKEEMKAFIHSTYNKNVALGSGAFGGAFSCSFLKKMSAPVLVSSVDGVGTKTKIAAAMNKFGTIGADIVNHSANDIVCIGARPLFFLDYIAASELKEQDILEIIKGMSAACKELGMPHDFRMRPFSSDHEPFVPCHIPGVCFAREGGAFGRNHGTEDRIDVMDVKHMGSVGGLVETFLDRSLNAQIWPFQRDVPAEAIQIAQKALAVMGETGEE